MEVFRTAIALMVRSMVLSAQSAGQQRMLHLVQSAGVGGEVGELARLRDENRRLQAESQLLKSRLGQTSPKRRYSPMQRLQILWHMAYYHIPRRRVKEHFLIAKSTLYRWRHAAEEGNLGDRKRKKASPRKTPREIAQMIWEMFEANPYFGRQRIANIVWLLGVFVAASTVRNVLLQPKPRNAPARSPARHTAPSRQPSAPPDAAKTHPCPVACGTRAFATPLIGVRADPGHSGGVPSLLDYHTLTPKERTTPEGAAYRSQIIR